MSAPAEMDAYSGNQIILLVFPGIGSGRQACGGQPSDPLFQDRRIEQQVAVDNALDSVDPTDSGELPEIGSLGSGDHIGLQPDIAGEKVVAPVCIPGRILFQLRSVIIALEVSQIEVITGAASRSCDGVAEDLGHCRAWNHIPSRSRRED